MKRALLLLLVITTMSAARTYAAGVDITTVACAGNFGSLQDGTLDCAGGGTFTLLMTFAPAERISDLVAVDALLDVYLHAGDIHSNATFWDFESANQSALGVNHLRPPAGCAGAVNYVNVWNRPGAGAATAALVRTPQNVRIAAGSYRPDNFIANANQTLFGWQLTIDASTSVESGGTGSGCADPACIWIDQAIPESAAGAPTTTLLGSNLDYYPVVGVNVPFGYCIPPDPVVRRSWAQLKSLYR